MLGETCSPSEMVVSDSVSLQPTSGVTSGTEYNLQCAHGRNNLILFKSFDEFNPRALQGTAMCSCYQSFGDLILLIMYLQQSHMTI